jgi:adenylate cyclase
MSDEQIIKKLQKEVQIYKKKLARSEANRITLEEIRDRNSNMFQMLNAEIEEQRRLIKEKNLQLEGLAKKLAKYLSPQVYDSIFSGEREVKIETYRKTLTVFFSDIVGFTSKSESMEAEELSQWLNCYLDRMAEIAIKYEGTLDKFIGDAVMVFFGDPKSEGEKKDALNCISMAMAMRQEAKKLGVNIRIGINTGECTVGNFGSENRMEYTVIGSAVNLASRLESSSKSGHILISDATHQFIGSAIKCKEREMIKVKGIDRDVKTFWVTEDLTNKNAKTTKRCSGFLLRCAP